MPAVLGVLQVQDDGWGAPRRRAPTASKRPDDGWGTPWASKRPGQWPKSKAKRPRDSSGWGFVQEPNQHPYISRIFEKEWEAKKVGEKEWEAPFRRLFEALEWKGN